MYERPLVAFKPQGPEYSGMQVACSAPPLKRESSPTPMSTVVLV